MRGDRQLDGAWHMRPAPNRYKYGVWNPAQPCYCMHVAWLEDDGCCKMCTASSMPGLPFDVCPAHVIMTLLLCACVSAPICAVCSSSPEVPTGGSFDCGNSSVAGTVCNGTCSTAGGPITATCEATGNWTVQGTCAQLQAGGEGLVPGYGPAISTGCTFMLLGCMMVGVAACAAYRVCLLGRCIMYA
jgi:hypothetical protein